ncbi:ROK family transcriptional regulator [Streptomyces sp. NBC_01803]|uniref:ROK family transcriptional regulator n=1 Tax=Streptomyces sp. NBC_01803 TaxID=2975946 RepID=UPI002DDC6A00|nr:ROK family transcriptional regulator [Streptomyces sp. NBC_01803]WSA42929.1 ROK family transcriptional regulator [Streptomyces sp. NBC_01803]
MAEPAALSQSEIRRRNLARVLHALVAGEPLSRAEVAARIGLTRAAVSTLVDELLRGGLLTEREPPPGRPGGVGRPGTGLLIADRGPCGVGAEIGVDHLAVCVMDLRGEVRVRDRRETQRRDGHRAGPDAVLGELTAMLRTAVAEAAEAGLRPAGLAVAVPGLVVRNTATVLHAANLGWRNADLGGPLPRDLGPVTVENEANLAALAELWSGRGAGDSFLHVSAEAGIGAAVVIDGELLRGAHGFAGELGHLPVRPEGRPCRCGGRGCLEAYAGEEALLRAAGLRPGPGVRVGALAARCEAGDPTALRAVRQAGAALGIALSGAVNLLDPRRVVIGGALSRLAPWLLTPVSRELARRTTVAAGGRSTPVPVTVSPLGPDGPLLGAAGHAVRAALDDPAALLRP